MGRRVLLASAGFTIGGGIASWSSSMAWTLARMVDNGRIDSVEYLALRGDRPPILSTSHSRFVTCGDSHGRFFVRYLEANLTRRPNFTLFDHVGIARSASILPSSVRSPYGVVVYGIELDIVDKRTTLQTLQRASKIIAISNTTLERLRRFTGSSVSEKAMVVAPCVSAERVASWSAEGTDDTAGRSSQILSVGRISAAEPGKGYDTLIRAMPYVLDSVPSARLIIAGGGDGREQLTDLVATLGVRHAVSLPGFVSEQQLSELYRTSAVFAMPSQQEGFGIVYAEAMWHGLPCLGSRQDAAVDVIDDGETGLLIEYGNAEDAARSLIELLTKPDLARRMGEAGRRKAMEVYSPESFETRFAQAINRVLRSA